MVQWWNPERGNKAYQSQGIQHRTPIPQTVGHARTSPVKPTRVQAGHRHDRLTRTAGRPDGPTLG